MILKIYITLIPVILAGVFNMAFVKLPAFNELGVPIDFGRNFIDDKRIFGENKTFKGALGMIIGGVLFSTAWGFVSKLSGLDHYNLFYENNANTFIFNIYIGFLLGLFYIIFELPNSFIKRRFDIKPGKTSEGKLKYLFIFIDQADSIIGCLLLVHIYRPLTFMDFILFTFLGAFTHIIINCFLYVFELRKNMF